MFNFGNILKELREEKGYSQSQLSELSEISQSALARYELNKTEPRLSDIRKLCILFGVSGDFILGIKDY